MKIFLNAKHWMLFIALVGMMLLARQALIGASEGGGSPIGFIIAKLLFSATLYGWLWSIGIGSYRALPTELKPPSKLMQYGFTYIIAYMLLSDLLVLSFMSLAPEFFVMMNMFSLLLLAYVMGFTAKQFVTLQKNDESSIFAYVGTLGLFFLYPLGVWFIQPTVNHLLGDQQVK